MTLAMDKVGENITLVNTVGGTYDFTPSHVFITLGVGWAAFVLALIFNLLYYVLHPSQVYSNFPDLFSDLIPGQREEFPREACCDCLWLQD